LLVLSDEFNASRQVEGKLFDAIDPTHESARQNLSILERLPRR